MKNNSKILLISLILIPVVLILITLGFLISISIQPQTTEYDFIYQVSEYGFYTDIVDGKISNNSLCSSDIEPTVGVDRGFYLAQAGSVENNSICGDDQNIEYYIHDTSTNISTFVSVDEISEYELLNTYKSPDGFEFESYYYDGSPFLINNSNSKENVLVKNNSATEQNLIKPNSNQNLTFVAWIKK